MGLGHAHISEPPAMGYLFEAVPPSAECDGSWRTLGSITGPTAEPGDDPGQPSDRVRGVGILLLSGLAFQPGLEGLKDRQLLRHDHVGGWPIDGTCTGKDELHDLGCCNHCDRRELEQCLGV